MKIIKYNFEKELKRNIKRIFIATNTKKYKTRLEKSIQLLLCF